MKTYADLTDEQLVELARIVCHTLFAIKGDTKIERLSQFVRVRFGLFELTLSNADGGASLHFLSHREHLQNIFQFVDKCREFGLTY